MSEQFGFGNQIIDVIKECTFEWSGYVPDTITAGTFPDSIISRDLNDYLEFEKTLSGAGYIGRLIIRLPENRFFIPLIIAGVGPKVDNDNDGTKTLRGVVYEESSMWGASAEIWQYCNANMYDRIMGVYISPGLVYGRTIVLYYYVNNQGTYRGRFHNIRILEVKI